MGMRLADSYHMFGKPSYFSAVFRRGGSFDFTHPDKVPEGVVIMDHYREMQEEFGNNLVDVFYGLTATETMTGARDLSILAQLQ